jgi:DNA alkylation damage repair protein AlkB
MSVAMTNCGRLGWVSDRTGYRYDPVDPDTGAPWPSMPEAFLDIAVRAAAEAGFANYDPDACLINRYIAGAKLSLHQDRDEKDAWAPIVSVSLGLPAVFLWGGKRRSYPVRRLRLESGDIVVWGGPARFVYHGVAPLKDGQHPMTGAARTILLSERCSDAVGIPGARAARGPDIALVWPGPLVPGGRLGANPPLTTSNLEHTSSINLSLRNPANARIVWWLQLCWARSVVAL